jgi:hypothetical protein
MKDKTPPGKGGVLVHSGEPDPSTTAPKNRNVLSLEDARRRKAERERANQPSKLVRDAFAAFEDDPRDPPPGGWAA